jgi:phosphate starvation-inducible PhoH-like protein
LKQKRSASSSVELDFPENETALRVYGDLNKNLLAIEQTVGVTIQARGTKVAIQGLPHEVEVAERVLSELYELVEAGYPVFPQDIVYAVRTIERAPTARLKDIFLDKVYVTARKRVVSPKSLNQKNYIEAIRGHDIVFSIGPAGTGKTYLAVAMAVSALTAGQVRSIILTRPAVEAGEKLGFLPGDMAQKVNPYLRPLYDALHDLLGKEKATELLEREIIEIAPLAFMRGRTLSNAFVILDEAQNSTPEQMKMFLTRLGFDSKAVITGDVTQIDLPATQYSGLLHASRVLKNIAGIRFCRFTDVDVVRHPLVQKIIQAYEKSSGGTRKSSNRTERQ